MNSIDNLIAVDNAKLNEKVIKNEINFIKKLRKVCYSVTKRTFDIVCSIVGVATLIPLAICIKIGYILTGDFTRIFYTQKRIGKDGREFDFYKFRSMIPNADEKLKEILARDNELAKEYKINKKLKEDPRVTKIGKFLRKTSLDEFPQFINVLKGDMSMVGNRPYLPREKEDMGEYFDEIVKTKGGIISYWAVNGRSDVSFQTRLEMESYYSSKESLSFDFKIFLKAFKTVFISGDAK